MLRQCVGRSNMAPMSMLVMHAGWRFSIHHFIIIVLLNLLLFIFCSNHLIIVALRQRKVASVRLLLEGLLFSFSFLFLCLHQSINQIIEGGADVGIREPATENTLLHIAMVVLENDSPTNLIDICELIVQSGDKV